MPARPAHTHSHTDTRSHPRAPPQRRRGSPHPVCRRREPLAGFWEGGAREGGRRGKQAGSAPEAPSHGTWGLAPVGWRGCCGGRGACPSREQTQLRPPPLSGAGGAGTWAGAIPRPKNNGRELGSAAGRRPCSGCLARVWADP